MRRPSVRTAGGGNRFPCRKRVRRGNGFRFHRAAYHAHMRPLARLFAGGGSNRLPYVPFVRARCRKYGGFLRYLRGSRGVGIKFTAVRALPILYVARIPAGARYRRVVLQRVRMRFRARRQRARG